jgi:glycosyltransferase involved in cell wall biosynthesis
VNAAVLDRLKEMGKTPLAINLATPTLNRSLFSRMIRVPRVLRGLWKLMLPSTPSGAALYMSISGGWGQTYELAFLVLARLRGMRLFVHHHSFSYLDKPSRLTGWLVRVAGAEAIHVTLSPRMMERLKSVYPVGRAVSVSNAVFLLGQRRPLTDPRRQLRIVGFISNIVAEKGVFEFLDLLDSLRDLNISLQAKLAGPFQDAETESKVRTRLSALPNVEYVGPKYGVEKDTFFSEIDALVFPTRYANEAEPVILHEAMCQGIPIIAYGRGAIPEMVCPESGKVIDPSELFLPAALEQIKSWLNDPEAFEKASGATIQCFAETYAQNEQRRKTLLDNIINPCALR